MPAMSLKQISNFFEVKYQNYLPKDWEIKSGVQINRVDNTNLPETGILPLIPDYIAHEYGVFGIVSKRLGKTSLELGGRYDNENRNVAAISISLPREIIRYENEYQNLSMMGGIAHEFNKAWKATYNIGYASRNPEVNELYSNGLHQGVSGIEEGDPNLRKEVSVKNTLSIKGKMKNKLLFEGLFYFQKIDDYIFTGKYSYLRGFDRTNSLPLVYIPSNNLYAVLNYQIPKFGKLMAGISDLPLLLTSNSFLKLY